MGWARRAEEGPYLIDSLMGWAIGLFHRIMWPYWPAKGP